MLAGLGLGALLICRNYRMGTAFRMGPGYFPVVLSSLLIVVGIIIAGSAFRGNEVRFTKFSWRPLIVVSVAVIFFGLILKGAGLALTTLVMVVASRVARPGYPWIETVILGVVISALCAGIFYFGLGIQMPLLPRWWG
jgi:putative tricarboxylic transport membrane protein